MTNHGGGSAGPRGKSADPLSISIIATRYDLFLCVLEDGLANVEHCWPFGAGGSGEEIFTACANPGQNFLCIGLYSKKLYRALRAIPDVSRRFSNLRWATFAPQYRPTSEGHCLKDLGSNDRDARSHALPET